MQFKKISDFNTIYSKVQETDWYEEGGEYKKDLRLQWGGNTVTRTASVYAPGATEEVKQATYKASVERLISDAIVMSSSL